MRHWLYVVVILGCFGAIVMRHQAFADDQPVDNQTEVLNDEGYGNNDEEYYNSEDDVANVDDPQIGTDNQTVNRHS